METKTLVSEAKVALLGLLVHPLVHPLPICGPPSRPLGFLVLTNGWSPWKVDLRPVVLCHLVPVGNRSYCSEYMFSVRLLSPSTGTAMTQALRY